MESVIRGALALHDNQQAGRFRIEGRPWRSARKPRWRSP